MSDAKSNQTCLSPVISLADAANGLHLGVPKMSRKLLILYGGETGNSEDLAKRIGWQALSKKYEIVANQFDDYQVGNLIRERFVLFICSTTNQGDEPASMRKFWSFIMRRSLPSDIMCELKCAVIGLGDSSYLRYNVVGKKLHKRLINLGAKMLLNICLGDDQHDLGLDAAVDKWLPDFWFEMDNYFKEKTSPIEQSFKLYDVRLLEVDEAQAKQSSRNLENSVYDEKNYYLSNVISNERMTCEDHLRDTRLLKLSLDDDNKSLIYFPGDVVMILPLNSEASVDEFLNLLNLDRSKQVMISKLNKSFLGYNLFDTIEDQPITIERIVREYFDLSSVPKRSFFEILSTYSTDKLEHDKLKEFASTNGQYALYEYCKKPKRSLLEVLIDFPQTTSKLRIQDLFQLINPIFARPYSIASSLAVCPGELHVLCAVKQLKTLLKKPRLGLCSNYIKQLNVGDKVRIYIKKGTLKIPHYKTPLIMIAPGTGVAPMRSIIQDRMSVHESTTNYLFFGCQYQKRDHYFEQEWTQAAELGLLNYYVAFSRDQPDKIYVQDKLWENRVVIWKLLSEQNGHLIVCGSSSQMPKDVRQMLIRILQDQGDELEEKKAEFIMDQFETTKILQFECWD